MQGTLRDMAVLDLIQHNCVEQKIARLTLKHADQTATIFFHGGNITHAICAGEQGEEAIYQIIAWEDGDFLLEMGITSPQKTITHNWSAILLEGARRLDEQAIDPELLFDQSTERRLDTVAQRIEDVLKEMSSEITGYMASAVVGMDALNIAMYSQEKMDIESVSAQMTLLMKLVDTSVTKIDGSAVLEDNLLTARNVYVLMRYLPGKKYYLEIMVDRKTAILGNLRLVSKIYAERVSKLIPH